MEKIKCMHFLNKNIKYISYNGLVRYNNILIYFEDQDIPYLMPRSSLRNLLFDEIYYQCKKTKDGKLSINPSISQNKISMKSRGKIDERRMYYNLSKLFPDKLEHNKIILISKENIEKLINLNKSYDIINKFKIDRLNQNIDVFSEMNFLIIQEIINLKLNKLDSQQSNNSSEKSRYSVYKRELFDAIDAYTASFFYFINKYLYRYNEEIFTDNVSKIESIKNFINNIITKIWNNDNQFNVIRKNNQDIYNYIENITKAVHMLDMFFALYGDYLPKTDNIVYRRMQNKYIGLNNIGDKIIIENFTSTSKNPDVFNMEVIIILEVDINIPVIDLTNKDKFNKRDAIEEEIILPRNLLFTLTNKYKKYKSNDLYYYYEIKATPMYNNQFQYNKSSTFYNTDCIIGNLYSFKPYINKKNYSKKSSKKSNKTTSKRRKSI